MGGRAAGQAASGQGSPWSKNASKTIVFYMFSETPVRQSYSFEAKNPQLREGSQIRAKMNTLAELPELPELAELADPDRGLQV